MKSIVSAALLFNCFFAGSGAAAISASLGPEDAYLLLRKQANVYLLDVRTPAEFLQIRLNGAHLIPIDQLVNRLDEIPRYRPILVYCAVGSRSAQVVSYLVRNGYSEVYNMYGGIYSWAKRGYPVLTGGP